VDLVESKENENSERIGTWRQTEGRIPNWTIIADRGIRLALLDRRTYSQLDHIRTDMVQLGKHLSVLQ